MTSPRELPPDEVAKISARLWENRNVIDEYLAYGGRSQTDLSCCQKEWEAYL
ncbi:MAG: hypothetical protein KHX56_06495 [Clostridiales bacterium]|nr:hypothetical protein [Clostridiales bacterium]